MMSANRSIILTGLCSLWLFLLQSPALPAAPDNGPLVVKVRAARHADFVRIVVTSEEPIVRKSAAVIDKNRVIAIDLRQEETSGDKGKKSLNVRTDKGAVKDGVPVELMKSVGLTLKGTALYITVPNVRDIKVSRLHSPSRIVIDVSVSSASAEDTNQTAALKALADQLSFRSFVIDAGHGGYEYGIRGARFTEKDFTIAFGRDLAGVLAKSGRDAVLTRKTDLVMTVSERISAANRKMPDIFISFHVSSTKVPTVYILPDRPEDGSRVQGHRKREVSRTIAEAIAKNIETEFSISVVRTQLPLPMLTMTRVPAVIVELPNPDEFSYEKKNRERMLSAVLKGLAAGAREDRQPGPVSRPEVKADKKTETKSPSEALDQETKAGTRADKKAETKAEKKSNSKSEEMSDGVKGLR
jgi:N-acetylmuramoyl-L-alanine amidase